MAEDDGYAKQLTQMRKEKDDWFKRSPHSPIPDRASFKGLAYFAPDPAFRVRATFEPAKEHKHVHIGTSTGEMRDYHIAGKLRFKIGNEEHTLTGFVQHGPREHEMFVPFRDATSGKESYGASRYLEVHMPHHDEAVIDFNMAYNPYCAYAEEYSCPLPPQENWLKAEIRAGERDFPK